MNDGVVDGLDVILQQYFGVQMVVLYLVGGWVCEGKLVGEVICCCWFNIYVEQECLFFCMLVFLVGCDCVMDLCVYIGFYMFYMVGGDDCINKSFDCKLIFDIYGKLGLLYDFIECIVDILVVQSWYLELGQLLQVGVLMCLVLGGEIV